MAHAAHVAVTVGRHLPHAEPHMLGAALLHDAPEFAPPPLLSIDRDRA